MTDSTLPLSVAVIGAGIAGLACAAELAAFGHRVSMFDKGRAPGGRVSTRRSGVLTFDHGAQFAVAHNEPFGRLLGELAVSNHVAAWPAASRGGEIVWVGTPGMSAIPHAMAATLVANGVTIKTATHVGWVGDDRSLTLFPAETSSPGFVSRVDGTQTEPFDAMAITVPAPQALTLLAAIGHRFTTDLARPRYAPCWAVMLSFSQACSASDVIRPTGSPLAWIARNNSRPGQAPVPETWVLHASAEWSRQHLEEPPDEVARLLLAEFVTITGQSTPPLMLRAHRWRYALVEQALGQNCLWDNTTKLGLAGDYCLGARVEAAFDSGQSLARAINAGMVQDRRTMERNN